jgi:dTDP-4-dehydrorhamnose 3,5-epimerase
MQLTATSLEGVFAIETAVFRDERGWLSESFNEPRFRAALAELGEPPPGRFVQDNHSVSHRGVLRGLHHQLPPHAQGKLVRVVQGRAWDVAVDLRRDSAGFGRWFGIELSAENRRQLWLPAGFAHGFVALEDNTQCLYKTTAVYDRASERSIRWDDPSLGIAWPLPDGTTQPRLSPRDAGAPLLANAELP